MESFHAIRDPRLPKRPRNDEFTSNGALVTANPAPVPTPARHAPAPFDQPSADAVLRSCDCVDFRVRSAILAEVSPVFRNMFTSSPTKRKHGHPEVTTADGKPFYICAENSGVLCVLLQYCYPVEDPEIRSAQALFDILDAALNYEMNYVVMKIGKSFAKFAEKESMKMYMYACRRKWSKGMSIAARASLSRGIQATELADLEDLENNRFITALELLRLQSYHKSCGQVASSIIGTGISPDGATRLKLSWLPHGNWIWFNCPHQLAAHLVEDVQLHDGVTLIASKWWTTYLRKAQEKLRCRPTGRALLDAKPLAAFAAAATDHCATCKRQVIEDLLTFNRLLAQEVEKAVDEVEFDHGEGDRGPAAHPSATP